MKRIKPFAHNLTPFYLIATPIGNMSELTPRAKEILSEATFVCCEDSRVAGLLLHTLGLSKPLYQVHKFNEKSKVAFILQKLNDGEKGVYISDAGYPLISDPGAPLIAALLAANYPLSVVNGPSALLHALVVSGFQSDHFYFHGFLNGKDSEKKKTLLTLKAKTEPLIFYEAPHRYLATLTLIYEVFGDRPLMIGRELTKRHEEYIYTTLGEIVKEAPLLKGELVLVLDGNKSVNDKALPRAEVEALIASGYSLKEATKIVSLLYHVSKNDLYDAFLNKN